MLSAFRMWVAPSCKTHQGSIAEIHALRPKHIINSPLGKSDGDIYNHYFNLVRAANPPPKEHPYFERLIRPLLQRQPLEIDDGSSIDLDEEIAEMVAEREQGKGGIGIGEEEPKTKAD